MRILFTFVGGRGHFEPLVPLARAAAEAGHAVAFACGAALAPAVAEAGFATRPLGPDTRASGARLPLRPVDREREERELRDRFVRGAARARVPLARALLRRERPDLLVADETDFGALLAAECEGVPHASALVTATGGFVRAALLGEALGELRAEHGLPPDPEGVRMRGPLALSPFPLALRDPAERLAVETRGYRALRPRAPQAPPPAWTQVRAGAPRVYFTLGTIFNTESGDLLHRVLAGLAALPANVLATVGPAIDPAELGAQPPHVRVARFVPQAEVLPHADLVVSHAGSGSLLGALAHGLPSLLLPLGADQPWNAERTAALGAARVLDAMAATPDAVRDAAAAVLADPALRRAAEGLRDAIAALPEPAEAVRRLERLASSR